MPVGERCHNKELFGPWLLRQINSNVFQGVYWLDEGRTLFRLPWKHLNIRSVNERDYAIFKAWAIHSGKYSAYCEDLPAYKTNFRCALKVVCFNNRKMFSEIKDNSSDPSDPHKIFKFHGIHEETSAAVDTSTVSYSTIEENNFHNEFEHDEDYRLRISPDVERTTPFINRQESAVLKQLLDLDLGEKGEQQVFDYSQDITRMDQVVKEPLHVPCLAEPSSNGHEQLLAVSHSQLLPEQYSQYPGYGMHHIGHIENFPTVDHGFQLTSACSQEQSAPPVCNFVETIFDEVQSCQYGFQLESTSHMMDQNATTHFLNACNTNGEMCTTQSPLNNTPPMSNGPTDSPTVVTFINQACKMPKLTSWEVTVFYRGKEVHKQNVSTKFYINYTGHVPQAEPADLVTFPLTSTTLVDQLQIEYTEKILDSVGNGVVLEVSPHDHKLYATRMGNSRVYWGMSESLGTKKNALHTKKLDRNIPTAIFDFNQFIQELKAYSCHERSSPDYTLYLCFGQNLFEPVKKALVLVKLVPNFCTFLHQFAQQEGASSLHNDVPSLQISNASSFNICDVPCLMDLDLSDFPGLF